MTEQLSTLATLNLRIRGTGKLAGKWLWTMTASRGGAPVQVLNWPNAVQNSNQLGYQFTPQFNEESSAMRIFHWDVANAYLQVLKSLGIEAEIVQG